jgi:O-antigen ligase
MDMRLGGLMVTGLEPASWVLAVIAGAALLLSTRVPRLGSRFRWVYPAVMAVVSVAVLVVDMAWWLTRSDTRAAAVAGVAGLWLWLAARERVKVLQRRREELVALGRRRIRDPRVRG